MTAPVPARCDGPAAVMSTSASCAPALCVTRFAAWLAELHRLAGAEEIDWVVDGSGATHREAFDAGHAPAQEMVGLRDMAQWRGCGCGAGG